MEPFWGDCIWMCNWADDEPGARLETADWKELSMSGFISARSQIPE